MQVIGTASSTHGHTGHFVLPLKKRYKDTSPRSKTSLSKKEEICFCKSTYLLNQSEANK